MRRAPLVPVALAFMALVALTGALGRADRLWHRHCPPQAYMTVCVSDIPANWGDVAVGGGKVLKINNIQRCGDIRMFFRDDSLAHTLRYGDTLLLHGYPDTLRRSIYLTADHYIVTGRDSASFRARSEALRMRLLRRMQRGPLVDGAVAEALALGWKGGIGRDTRAHYRDAGLAHLLAVSGLHVGLLAAMVGAAFFWTGRERRGRVVRGGAQLAAVWLFALVTGLAPSTLRAALMFSMFIVNSMVARRVVSLNLLALAAIVMLCADPLLLYDVGWQLSFSAVAGIMLAQPAISALRTPVGQAAAVSTAATLATMPVVVATFHRLPLYFLVANVVVVPAAGFILGLSLLYMLLPCAVTAWPLGLLLRGVDALTAWVGSLPYAVAEDIHLSTPLLLALTVVVVVMLLLPQLLLRRSD